MTSDEIAEKISEYNGTIQLVDIMFTGMPLEADLQVRKCYH